MPEWESILDFEPFEPEFLGFLTEKNICFNPKNGLQ